MNPNPNGGGGGNGNVAPVDDSIFRRSWKKNIIGLKGGCNPRRGGWGPFIGLKGGTPIFTQSTNATTDSSSTSSNSTPKTNPSVLTTANKTVPSIIAPNLPPGTLVTVVGAPVANVGAVTRQIGNVVVTNGLSIMAF